MVVGSRAYLVCLNDSIQVTGVASVVWMKSGAIVGSNAFLEITTTNDSAGVYTCQVIENRFVGPLAPARRRRQSSVLAEVTAVVEGKFDACEVILKTRSAC